MSFITKHLIVATLVVSLLTSAVPAQAATNLELQNQLNSIASILQALKDRIGGKVLGVDTSNGLVYEYTGGDTFNGTNDIVNSGFDVGGVTNVTVVVKAKPYKFDGREGVISSPGGGILIHYNLKQWEFRFNSPSADICKSRNGATLPNLNEWNFMAFTYDGTNCGVHFAGNYQTIAANDNLALKSGSLNIGRGNTAYADSWFDGEIAYVKVYDRALTEAELDSLANGEDLTPSPTPEPTPVPTPEPEPTPTPVPTPEPESAPEPITNSDEVYYSSQELGWTAGENISTKFRDFINNTAKAGDTLILEHMYTYSALSSEVTFPPDFTLAAQKGGGMNIIDTTTSADDSYPTNLGFLFSLSDRNTINNVVFNMPEAVDSGGTATNPTRHVDFSNLKLIEVNRADDVTIFQTEFNGFIGHHLQAGYAKNLTFHRTLVNGGFWAVVLGSGVDDFRSHHSVFQNSKGDGIKTGGHGCPAGVLRPVVTESIFENNVRDGIDTTGGFAEGVIRDSIFRNNHFTSLDLKNHFEKSPATAFCPNRLNRDILIENTLFLDSGNNAVVLTTLDRTDPPTIDNNNAPDYIVKNITIRDSVVQLTNDNRPSRRFIMSKDAHDIYWDNIELLGDVNSSEVRVLTNTAIQNAGVTNTNYNLVGTNVTKGPARNFPEQTDYPFPFGQGTLSLNIPDPDDVSTPTPTPLPTPTPEPTPTLTPAPLPEVEEIVVTDPVNVREKPTVSSPILEEKQPGDTGEVIEDVPEVTADGHNWIPVNFENGLDGWVVEKNVRRSGGGGGIRTKSNGIESATDSITNDTTTNNSPTQKHIRTTANLNVRATPGGTLVRLMPLGSRATRLSDTPITQGGHTWINVRFDNGTEGYVASTYTTTDTGATATNRVRTTDNLNVRSTPGGQLIKQVLMGARGTKVSDTLIDQGGYRWLQVRFDDGTEGYVASGFLTTDTPATTSTFTPEKRAEILSLITALLAQVQTLQAQLDALRTGS